MVLAILFALKLVRMLLGSVLVSLVKKSKVSPEAAVAVAEVAYLLGGTGHVEESKLLMVIVEGAEAVVIHKP
jgi:hypothetical protein